MRQLNLIDGDGMTGEEMMELADKWVNENWLTWNKMLNKAAEYVSEGRRFSMETLFQFARYECGKGKESQGFQVNNNTRSALARKMLKQYPGWAKFVDKRTSKVDWQ